MLYSIHQIHLINMIIELGEMKMPERTFPEILSELLQYLATIGKTDAGKLPSLVELSQQLEISIPSLREQLEVARALGLVEVRPRTGIKVLPYSFRPAVRQSLAYALAVDPAYFQKYSDLRNHIEAAYWYQAVGSLVPEDHQQLQLLIAKAWQKLRGYPIQIPHNEHRELHLLIYKRLDNPFVTGLLETYWELYEATGLDVYADYQYLEHVWQYHQAMVSAICSGDFEGGYQAMIEHMDLLAQRAAPLPNRHFE
jgi:DNA-binding FadR family transcriptional regulator